MRVRLQSLLLIFALLAVAAFLVSFVLGLRGAADTEGRDGFPYDVAVDARKPRVRVEVLNGAGTGGLAREATGRLRELGFDVVFFGNARETGRPSSVVLDRIGNPEGAEAVAAALGIAQVESKPDPELLLEVTVVLGKDWPPAEEARAKGWRRWVPRFRR